jgi:hypothetical protein
MVPRVPKCLWCRCPVHRCMRYVMCALAPRALEHLGHPKYLKHLMHQHQGTEAHQALRHLQYSGYHVKNKTAHSACNAAKTVIQA